MHACLAVLNYKEARVNYQDKKVLQQHNDQVSSWEVSSWISTHTHIYTHIKSMENKPFVADYPTPQDGSSNLCALPKIWSHVTNSTLNMCKNTQFLVQYNVIRNQLSLVPWHVVCCSCTYPLDKLYVLFPFHFLWGRWNRS